MHGFGVLHRDLKVRHSLFAVDDKIRRLIPSRTVPACSQKTLCFVGKTCQLSLLTLASPEWRLVSLGQAINGLSPLVTACHLLSRLSLRR